MSILESMSLLQKEKLSVIKKELLHLRNIAGFYSGDTKKSSTIQRDKMAQVICKELEGHIKQVSILFRRVTQNERYLLLHSKGLIPFLTRYDQLNLDIKELLKLVSFIQSKLSQFLQDGFNHYIPIPMTSKRYSSKGFLDYLKSYYEEILKITTNEETAKTISPLIFWGHNISFTAEEPNYGNKTRHYIETAYWNYEIPVLLPAMSHELGHILLNDGKRSEENKLSPLFNYIYRQLKENSIFVETSMPKNKTANIFLDEIVSDIFAYMTLGNSYILTMAHEFMGKGFARMFLVENHTEDIMQDTDISFNAIDTSDLAIIEPLARLLILLDFSQGARRKNDDLHNYVDEIDIILRHIVPHIEKQKQGTPLTKDEVQTSIEEAQDYHSLQKYYAILYPNFWKDYDKFHASVFAIVNTYRETIKTTDTTGQTNFDQFHEELGKTIESLGLETNNIVQDYKKIFLKLWNERLQDTKRSIVKNLFRKLILQNDDTLPSEKFGEAYELTFFKTRADAFAAAKSYSDSFTMLTNTIKSHYCDPNPYASTDKPYSIHCCLDLFNAVLLREKNEVIAIKKLNSFLEADFTKSEKPFYAYKHSLIRISSALGPTPKEGFNKLPINYNLLIQIQLINNDKNYSQDAIRHIKKFLEDNKERKDFYYKNMEIFKSLGPKELVLNFTGINFYTIQYIKSNLLFNEKSSIYKRSYSTIYGSLDDFCKIDTTSKYNILSTLRLKGNASNQEFQNILSVYTKDISSYRTMGVTDITIVWKNHIEMKKVLSLYDELIKGRFTSDIQTKINEKYFPIYKKPTIPSSC